MFNVLRTYMDSFSNELCVCVFYRSLCFIPCFTVRHAKADLFRFFNFNWPSALLYESIQYIPVTILFKETTLRPTTIFEKVYFGTFVFFERVIFWKSSKYAKYVCIKIYFDDDKYSILRTIYIHKILQTRIGSREDISPRRLILTLTVHTACIYTTT